VGGHRGSSGVLGVAHQAGHERDCQPGADVAVRTDATHVLWALPFRSAQLLPQYAAVLDEVTALATHPDPHAMTDVVGHTSTSGPNDINQELSEQRAHPARQRGVPLEHVLW
jgi:outer membrane protein OmpA-like peptidoglycan-associated protein